MRETQGARDRFAMLVFCSYSFQQKEFIKIQRLLPCKILLHYA